MKMTSGQVHKAAGQLHAFVGQVHAPVGWVGWFSYGGAARVVLALVLVAVAAGAVGAGVRLRVSVRLPWPGRTARTVMLATWGLAIVAFLVCFSIYEHQLIQQHLIHSRPPQPIFPVTAACMVALFFAILYMGRSLNQEARLGSAFIGAIAAPMIFEFPFDLMVMTRTYPAVGPDPALYRVLVFAPLFLVEFTTLALLSLSPLVRLDEVAVCGHEAFPLAGIRFGLLAAHGGGLPGVRCLSGCRPYRYRAERGMRGSRHGRRPVSPIATEQRPTLEGRHMSDVSDAAWQAFKIVPYGAVLHVPAGWEALPPVPANGPEVLRATGGHGRNLIVFKVPTNGRTAAQVADVAQEKLAAHGYDDFARTEATFAGQPGVALDFVTRRGSEGAVIYRTQEYFAVRGTAAFILGMGSAAWEEHLPLIEQIAEQFEFAE